MAVFGRAIHGEAAVRIWQNVQDLVNIPEMSSSSSLSYTRYERAPMQDISQSRRSIGINQWLWVAVAGVVAFGLYEASHSLAYEVKKRSRAADLSALERPTDGVGVDVQAHFPGVVLHKGRDTLLIAMGACDGCSVNKFDPTQVPSQYSQVLLVWASSSAKEMKLPSHFLVATDRDGTFHAKINAQITPRYYEVNSSLLITEARSGGSK